MPELLMTILTLLLYIVLVAIVVYIIIYVLGAVGIAIPPKVMQLIWVAFALLVIIWLLSALFGGGMSLPTLRG